jgi:hypothetical protein
MQSICTLVLNLVKISSTLHLRKLPFIYSDSARPARPASPRTNETCLWLLSGLQRRLRTRPNSHLHHPRRSRTVPRGPRTCASAAPTAAPLHYSPRGRPDRSRPQAPWTVRASGTKGANSTQAHKRIISWASAPDSLDPRTMYAWRSPAHGITLICAPAGHPRPCQRIARTQPSLNILTLRGD